MMPVTVKKVHHINYIILSTKVLHCMLASLVDNIDIVDLQVVTLYPLVSCLSYNKITKQLRIKLDIKVATSSLCFIVNYTISVTVP